MKNEILELRKVKIMGETSLFAQKFKVHANFDTACRVDERFERPWQSLKGIYIKHLCMLFVLPHHYKTI
jgi:hypothetical protein